MAVPDLLFAAALAFHNAVWRYAFALGREGVLPGCSSRTGSNNIPKAASLAQSAPGWRSSARSRWPGGQPMTGLFFGGGTTGGFGILLLLRADVGRGDRVLRPQPAPGESAWGRLIAPALAAILLTGMAVLAVLHYDTLLGVPPGSAAAWALPAGYAVLAVAGLAGAWSSRSAARTCTPTIGLGAHAASVQAAAAGYGARP